MKLIGFYTTAGLNLASQQGLGTSVILTSAVAGSGDTSPSDQTLSQPQQTLTLGTAVHSGTTVTVPVTLDCQQTSQAFELTEIGLFATHPQLGEILYQVYRVDHPFTVTANAREILRFYLQQTLSESQEIEVTVSPTGVILERDLLPIRAAILQKANLSQLCNPNLLDNAWFTVNQRGVSAGSAGWSEYFLDRWKGLCTYTVTTDGLRLEKDSFLVQPLEKPLSLPVTASVLLSDGSISSVLISESNGGHTIADYGYSSPRCNVPAHG